ncbi:MAG: hypothetical protein ACLQVG_09985, partial [Terriglobia bacterium]
MIGTKLKYRIRTCESVRFKILPSRPAKKTGFLALSPFSPKRDGMGVGCFVSQARKVIPSVITSKPAMHDRVKTGHVRPSGTRFFYPAAGSVGKSVFVR